MTYVNDHNEQNITTYVFYHIQYIYISKCVNSFCSHGLLKICRIFFSHTLDCLQARTLHYIQLCEENLYNYEANSYIACAFFREVVQQCGNSSYIWNIWRAITSCGECCVWMCCAEVSFGDCWLSLWVFSEKPTCPGDLIYVEQGPAFPPSCSNPNPAISNQDLVASCVCPKSKHHMFSTHLASAHSSKLLINCCGRYAS